MHDANNDSNAFAQRLNYLFEITGATYKEVVTGTRGAVKEAYLYQLRTGKAKNPSYNVIRALADYFRVSPGYFFDGEATPPQVTEEVISKLLSQMGNEDDQGYQLAFRSLIVNLFRYVQAPKG